MKTFYDVQQLLKKYGIIIYVGDQMADLQLMEMELRELYKAQLLEREVFQTAIMILRQRMSQLK